MSSSLPLHRRVLTNWGALLALALAGTILVAGCGGDEANQTEAGYVLDTSVEDSTIAAIAEVQGFTDTLTYENLQREMNRLTRGRLPMLPDSVQQQVQRMSVVRFLTTAAQIGEAQERGIEVDSAAVSGQLQKLRAQVGSDSLFRARLAQTGMSLSQLRDNIRQQLMVRNLQQALADEVEDPTTEEIETYRNEQAREVRVQQILFEIPPRATPQQRDSVRLRAQQVLDSIRSGTAEFTAMAQRYNQGGGDETGSMGYQTREQMAGPLAQRGQPPSEVPFVQTAFALQDSGDVAAEPVQSRYGYHLIRSTGARTGTLMDTSRARQQLAQQRRQEELRQAVEGLRESVVLRINPERVTADMSQPLNQGGEEDQESSAS